MTIISLNTTKQSAKTMNFQPSEHLENCKITQTLHKSVHFVFYIINHNTGGVVVLFKCRESEGLERSPVCRREPRRDWWSRQPSLGLPLAGHAPRDQSGTALQDMLQTRTLRFN